MENSRSCRPVSFWAFNDSSLLPPLTNPPPPLTNGKPASIMASEIKANPSDVSSESSTIFDKIINKEIPADIVYENDKVLAFRDVNPLEPTHILIIPKMKDGLTRLSKAEERHIGILGQLLYTAKLVAKQEGLQNGFRLVINDGPTGGQCSSHLQIHLLGGRKMNWLPC